MNSREVMVNEYTKRQFSAYARSLRELSSCYGKEVVSKNRDENREEIFDTERRNKQGQLLSNYLRDISFSVEQMLEKSEAFIRFPDKEEKRIRSQLRKEKLIVGEIYYLSKEKEAPICFLMCSKKRGGHKNKDVAGLISVILQRRLSAYTEEISVIGEKPVFCIYGPEKKYICLHGIARIAKEGNEVSGDNFSIVEQDRGQVTAILSDGMGSGEKAATDSCQVLDYMERFLDSGLSLEKSMNAVNRLLLLREEGNMSTMDLCNIDLCEGACRFYKIGGVCSFLKSNTYVETIVNPCLPLGLWVEKEQAFYLNNRPVIERELVDGDYIVMVTDGVLEAMKDCGYEKGISQFLSKISDKYPKDMAERLIQYVLHCCKGKVEDDMTILVLRIFDVEK